MSEIAWYDPACSPARPNVTNYWWFNFGMLEVVLFDVAIIINFK